MGSLYRRSLFHNFFCFYFSAPGHQPGGVSRGRSRSPSGVLLASMLGPHPPALVANPRDVHAAKALVHVWRCGVDAIRPLARRCTMLYIMLPFARAGPKIVGFHAGVMARRSIAL